MHDLSLHQCTPPPSAERTTLAQVRQINRKRDTIQAFQWRTLHGIPENCVCREKGIQRKQKPYREKLEREHHEMWLAHEKAKAAREEGKESKDKTTPCHQTIREITPLVPVPQPALRHQPVDHPTLFAHPQSPPDYETPTTTPETGEEDDLPQLISIFQPFRTPPQTPQPNEF
jgi:hypothetical protein